jgi:probable rRNA maturation factor
VEVQISNQQSLIKISLKKIQQKAQVVLNALECHDGELSILFVDDKEISRLNKTYLHRNGPTNVIAFPMMEGEFSDINRHLLGDVVISVETAENESKLGGMTMEDRLNELLVHGILHLFGYDHEKPGSDALKMEHKAIELLKIIHDVCK